MTDHVTQADGSTTLKRRQYSIAYLLLLTAIGAFAMLPIVYWGSGGWPLSLWILLMGIALLCARYFICCALLALALLGVLVFAGTGYRGPRAACSSNLNQLAFAIAFYESTHGHFPPPYIADENGVPMHSWRVLILPYIEEQQLYDQYDFTKPWNHPDNLKLADQMPSVFACPVDESAFSKQTTTYVAIVGPNTMWPPQGNRQARDVRDSESKTLLLIESDASRTHWMAPNDMLVSDIVPATENGQTMLLTDRHEGNAAVVFAGDHAEFMDSAIPADKLKALATINGNDNEDLDEL